MQTKYLFNLLLAGFLLIMGCKSGQDKEATGNKPEKADKKTVGAKTKINNKQIEKKAMIKEVQKFMAAYNQEFANFELVETTTYWAAANSGKKEDWDKNAQAKIKLKQFHSDKKKYEQIQKYLQQKKIFPPLLQRSLKIAKLAFSENQLPEKELKQMVKAEKEIERAFSAFRGKIGEKEFSNNELLQMLKKEKDSKKRKEIWNALKSTGEKVGDMLIQLAKKRNKAAKTLGFKNYWEMKIKLQEHDPDQVLKLFTELDKLTVAPFKQVKAEIDKEIAKKLNLKGAEQVQAWHYNNPFFQEAPPSKEVDPDIFYKDKKKEEIVQIASKFFEDIALPIDDIVSRSDLYERKGKDQHAFCITINRSEDVRTLLNIKASAKWMDTMLHEAGHAVYYKFIKRELPHNLKEAAHILTTEGIAMMFGALAKNQHFLKKYVEAKDVDKYKDALLEQRRREQLIFTRWVLVMFNFERQFYLNPDQNLNSLWWKLVNKYQLIPVPENRNKADWASKPHFTIAPVYYHNYLMGELFAAQLRKKLSALDGYKGNPAALNFNGKKKFGAFLKKELFAPGASKEWNQLVKEVTGSELSARAFANEVNWKKEATPAKKTKKVKKTKNP
ncbi:MAG: M2 family metallopeptidase [Deltaproteobacteria bacterium]|jgi:peptidyl-dipeptidase A|nr:M2 family metallopeptidase [Deltaproteobacteria bacterium]